MYHRTRSSIISVGPRPKSIFAKTDVIIYVPMKREGGGGG